MSAQATFPPLPGFGPFGFAGHALSWQQCLAIETIEELDRDFLERTPEFLGGNAVAILQTMLLRMDEVAAVEEEEADAAGLEDIQVPQDIVDAGSDVITIRINKVWTAPRKKGSNRKPSGKIKAFAKGEPLLGEYHWKLACGTNISYYTAADLLGLVIGEWVQMNRHNIEPLNGTTDERKLYLLGLARVYASWCIVISEPGRRSTKCAAMLFDRAVVLGASLPKAGDRLNKILDHHRCFNMRQHAKHPKEHIFEWDRNKPAPVQENIIDVYKAVEKWKNGHCAESNAMVVAIHSAKFDYGICIDLKKYEQHAQQGLLWNKEVFTDACRNCRHLLFQLGIHEAKMRQEMWQGLVKDYQGRNCEGTPTSKMIVSTHPHGVLEGYAPNSESRDRWHAACRLQKEPVHDDSMSTRYGAQDEIAYEPHYNPQLGAYAEVRATSGRFDQSRFKIGDTYGSSLSFEHNTAYSTHTPSSWEPQSDSAGNTQSGYEGPTGACNSNVLQHDPRNGLSFKSHAPLHSLQHAMQYGFQPGTRYSSWVDKFGRYT